MDCAVLVLNIPGNLGQLLAGNGDHLHQKRGGVNAIFAVDMTAHRQSARGLAADDGIRLIHLRRDIFEANRHFVALLSKAFRNLVKHVGSRHVADYRALPAFVLDEIVIKHYQNVVGMEEFARIVDHAHTVGVSR